MSTNWPKNEYELIKMRANWLKYELTSDKLTPYPQVNDNHEDSYFKEILACVYMYYGLIVNDRTKNQLRNKKVIRL